MGDLFSIPIRWFVKFTFGETSPAGASSSSHQTKLGPDPFTSLEAAKEYAEKVVAAGQYHFVTVVVLGGHPEQAHRLVGIDPAGAYVWET